MTVQLIFKIAAVGILVSLLNQVLKHAGREDLGYLLTLVGLLLVLSWVVPCIYELFQIISALFNI